MAQTHDYTRHGTTTLCAALDVLAGTVLGRCMQRHRNSEFIRFLNAVEAAVPPSKVIHAILDNVATGPPAQRAARSGKPDPSAGRVHRSRLVRRPSVQHRAPSESSWAVPMSRFEPVLMVFVALTAGTSAPAQGRVDTRALICSALNALVRRL